MTEPPVRRDLVAAPARPGTAPERWPAPVPPHHPRPDGDPEVPPGFVVASPGRRLGAWLLDGAGGWAAATAALWWAGGVDLVRAFARLALSKSAPAGNFGGFDLRPLLHGQPIPASEAARLLLVAGTALAVTAAWVAYKVGATARFGATAGKALLGLRVVRVADPDSPPGLAAALTRWAVPQGSGLIPLPGTGLAPYLWVWRDPAHRGLHDRAAGTVVVLGRSRPGRRPA